MLSTTSNTEVKERLLKPREVAYHLRVDSATVRRWVKDGKMAAVRLPSGAYRIKVSVLDAIYGR